jgi:hypothetical protein
VTAFEVLVVFEGAVCIAVPFGDPVSLTEQLDTFCRLVLSSPDVSACVAGLHEHVPGSCARAGKAGR